MPTSILRYLPVALLLFIGIATSLVTPLLGQPAICPPDESAVMTPFCEQACVICDIDGFTGRNGRDNDYFLPDDFCTLQQHNGKWIGFIAGSENLEISLSVSNCELGFGLEISIYEAIDCDNYTVVSNCFGGFTAISPNNSGTFSNIIPLVVGQYYYMVMDGARDDVCDWEFTVLSGTTEVLPLTSSGPISGPLTVCPDVPTFYETAIETGATEFSWTVEGVELASGPTPSFIWNQIGNFELCVTASNACDQAEPFCTDVLVRSIPTTVIDTIFCSDDSFTFADSIINDGGQYNFNFVTALGCDSNFVINLTEVPADATSINLNICSDDELVLNGQTFTQAGSYQQLLTNRFGCDSTLSLELGVIVCNIQADQLVTNVSCPGATDGSVSFFVTAGTPPFTYALTDLTGTQFASGNISGLNESILINDLAAGTFQITILDEFGNDTRILNLIVGSPQPLSTQVDLSNFASFGVSCFGGTDGTIDITPLGGIPDYSINWQDGTTTFMRSQLAAGEYAFTLTDANGCDYSQSVILSQPSEIIADISFNNADCSGPETASILVDNVSGGAGNYLYRLNGGSVVDTSNFRQLAPGPYALEIIDVNGCSSVFDTTLRGTVIPEVVIDGEAVVIPLGEAERIAFSTFNADTLLLGGDVVLNLIDSGTQFITLMPINSGQLIITALSVDGCPAVDSIRIVVDARRDVYAPNAFSPNSDGINDRFELFPGTSVASIENLRVFDRWGGLLFEQTANDPFWTGLDASQGIYVWTANIIFLDGVEEIRSGSVLLTR